MGGSYYRKEMHGPGSPSSSVLITVAQNSGQRWANDHDLYAVPDAPRASEMASTRQQRFLEQREKLLQLQIRHMKIRIKEAEEGKEEAWIRKEIAKRECQKLNNLCNFFSSIYSFKA